MNCSIENIKDDNLQALVQQYGAREGMLKFINGEVSQGDFSVTLDDEVSKKDSFPINSQSVKRILKGEKSLSVKPSHTSSGTYLIEGSYFKVTNQGSYRLDDYLELSGKSVEEVREQFIGNEEIKEIHIQDFFDNKVHMYVYDIQPSEGNMSINPDSSIQDRALMNLQSTLNAVERAIKKRKM